VFQQSIWFWSVTTVALIQPYVMIKRSNSSHYLSVIAKSRSLTTANQLLGNDSVNIFPREPTRATIGRLLLGNGSVTTPKTILENRGWCLPWGPSRGYITRSSKRAVNCCREFGRVPELAVEDNWEEIARKESGGVKKTSFVTWSYSETVITPLPGYD
jgi:hypothetical protein